MRWRVKLNEMTGDVLAETLAAAGFELDGDMLSGEQFEALDDYRAVSHMAFELGHRIREIARMNPDLGIGFQTGPVHEYLGDGSQIGEHHNIYATLADHVKITGLPPRVINSAISPEEQAEIERQARAAKATQLMRAIMQSDLVLLIMRLLDGEPGSLELGKVHELIEDDADGDLSRFAPSKQFSRFTRSINHPGVFGEDARHAIPKGDLPRDPMEIGEATLFIRNVAEKWIKEKADRENH